MAMKLKAIKADVTGVETAAVVVNLFQGVTKPSGATGAIDRALDGQLTQMIADGELTGSLGETRIVHTGGRLPARRVAVIGLGKRDGFDLEALRRAVGTATRQLLATGITEWHTVLHGGGSLKKTTPRDLAETIAEATLMGAYRWDRFKTTTGPTGEGRPVPKLEDVTMVEADGRRLPQIRRGLDRGSKLAEAVNYTRDLGNSPPNEMTPAALADHARKLGDQHAMTVEVLTVEDLKQQGMGGILGVGQGSHNGPRLMIVRYDRGRPSAKPTIIVGKAVTFDAGGISIKPSRRLEEMKFDKMGGCAVLGILKAAALLGLKQSLIGVIPAAENLPSGAAYRPGDILESYSGKTIEVINTDAEGRLILADGLAWASEQDPREIIDIATLTGACVVALGETAAGVFGDERAVSRFVEAGARTGDRAWALPLYEEFSENMRSEVADIKNAGGHWGGASNAAAFLKFFVGDSIQWTHLDIAGNAYVTKPRHYEPIGATGAGVRLVIEYLTSR
jgi:leucyl aminopeptidase